jgi:hypothetical protein
LQTLPCEAAGGKAGHQYHVNTAVWIQLGINTARAELDRAQAKLAMRLHLKHVAISWPLFPTVSDFLVIQLKHYAGKRFLTPKLKVSD